MRRPGQDGPRTKDLRKIASRPISRVLSGGCPPRRPFLWGAHCCVPRATNPGGGRDQVGPVFAPSPSPPLFGLAPVGVGRAAAVAGSAVRSYRTVSPLPRGSLHAGGL